MTLLDTNILLWLFMGDRRLSPDMQYKIEQDPTNYFVSIVSIWEIATKRVIGKLELTMDLPKAVEEAGFTSLFLSHAHIYQYEQLPLIHRDPFDRMLVAQALSEKVSMVSSDTFLSDYGVRIIAP
jgi:PIN domain nuclease of toxin-antitoxin system